MNKKSKPISKSLGRTAKALIVGTCLTLFASAFVAAQDHGSVREATGTLSVQNRQVIQMEVFTRLGQTYELALYEAEGIYIGRGRVREIRQITFPVDPVQFNKLIKIVGNTQFFEGPEIPTFTSIAAAGISITVRLAGSERKRTFHPIDRIDWLMGLVTQIETVANTARFRCPFSAPHEQGGSSVEDFCKLNEEFLNGRREDK